jgi:hypothetical protein
MTLQEFESIIKTADPSATHYFGTGSGNYTRWAEYGSTALHVGDRRKERTLRIQVDRFTKLETDPVVDAIDGVLEHDEIAIRDHLVDVEVDTGYIHHIWDIEVV